MDQLSRTTESDAKPCRSACHLVPCGMSAAHLFTNRVRGMTNLGGRTLSRDQGAHIQTLHLPLELIRSANPRRQYPQIEILFLPEFGLSSVTVTLTRLISLRESTISPIAFIAPGCPANGSADISRSNAEPVRYPHPSDNGIHVSRNRSQLSSKFMPATGAPARLRLVSSALQSLHTALRPYLPVLLSAKSSSPLF